MREITKLSDKQFKITLKPYSIIFEFYKDIYFFIFDRSKETIY